MKQSISIVVPVFNEEKNVEPLHGAITSVMKEMKISYEIIFVDDGSTDNSFSVMKKIFEKDNNVNIVRLRKNFGQTAALDSGFKNAKGDVIVVMDADMQNDPRDIPKLLAKLEEGYDVVSGWRQKRKDSLSKVLFSRIANRLRRFLTGERIHDSGCSLKAYRKDCVKELTLYGEMHRYIPALLAWKGYKIGEVVVSHHPRLYGKSKYNARRIINGFLDLLVIKFWMQYSARPIHLFGGGGLFLMATGFLLGGWLLFMRIFFGFSLANRTTPLLAVLLVVLGVQFFLSGILADIAIKNYFENTDRRSYSIEKILSHGK